MNADSSALSQHPAPHRGRVAASTAAFGVIGGPLGWFIQLCAGYALAAGPCFLDAQRVATPAGSLRWTWPAMIALLIAGLLMALAAFAIAWRAFERTREEAGGDEHHLMEVGAGRTRILALWGMLLGAGFATATAITAVAFAVLPRCAG